MGRRCSRELGEVEISLEDVVGGGSCRELQGWF